MAFAAEPAAAEVVGARAGAGKAAASKSRWAGKQATVLRDRGLSDAQIRDQLKGAGYDAKTSKAAAPSKQPPAAPADPVTPAASSTPAAGSSSSAAPPPADRLGNAARSRASYLSGKPGAKINGSGLLLGLVAYPLALAFIRGGPAGMKAWLAAKFLNRVSAASGSTPQINPGTLV